MVIIIMEIIMVTMVMDIIMDITIHIIMVMGTDVLSKTITIME
jgi:hypothetical protein